MKPINFSFTPFPQLETERLRLRPLKESDAVAYLEIRQDPRVNQYLARAPATDVSDVTLLIQRAMRDIANNEDICWGMCLKSSDSIIGTIGYYRSKPEHFRSEIGYEMHPEYWGRGIMHEAMRVILDYGFLTMNLHSIEANVDPQNHRSSGLLLRNNFVQEAYFRENYFGLGCFHDSVIYSLLKSRHLEMTRQL